MDRAERFIAAMNAKTSPFGIVGAGFYGMAYPGETHGEISTRFIVCFIMMKDFRYKQGIEQIVPVSELDRMTEDLLEKYPAFIVAKMEEHAGRVLAAGGEVHGSSRND